MRAEIICVGTELLLGSTVNTDASDVARLLSEYGVNVYHQSVVGDNPERVSEAVRLAKSRADMIVTTGGLGPTCDDLTKDSVAAAFGLDLVLDEKEAAHMRTLFEARNYVMTPNNLQQAYLPRGATALKNHEGTAPGCMFTAEGVTVIMLPGPPRELREMLESEVRPILERMTDNIIVSHNIKFAGIGESEMEFYLRDYMQELQNPSLAPYAKEDECYVRVTARAKTREEAEVLMAPVIERVQNLLPEFVYGVDQNSLAASVLISLAECGKTVAVAETCTGGEIAKRLTDNAGASQSFMGGVTVYTERAAREFLDVPEDLIKNKGMISAAVTAQLASNIRTRLGSDIGLAVTGLAGPEGDGVHEVGTMYMALSTEGKTEVRRTDCFGRNREGVRKRGSQYALDMLRRYIKGYELKGDMEF